jgi:hypothetical protein
MLIVIITVITLMAVIGGFWFFGRKPAIHRQITPAKLEKLLSVLLNQGSDGGALFVRGKGDIPFIQVMKYVGREGVGLQLDFPRAPWAQPFLPGVEASLRKYHPLATGGWTERGNDLEFITVDFGTDVKKAAACVTDVAENALGLPLTSSGRVQLMQVSSDPNAKTGF